MFLSQNEPGRIVQSRECVNICTADVTFSLESLKSEECSFMPAINSSIGIASDLIPNAREGAKIAFPE